MALKVGDRVMVQNRTLSGKVVDEGIATIREIGRGCSKMHRYAVEFDDEPGQLYQRYVGDDVELLIKIQR